MAAKFLSLPEEIQIRILRECDPDTLSVTCRTGRVLCEKARLILWTSIDFVSMSDHWNDTRERQRRFFSVCDQLRREHADRWTSLATLPRSLRLSCLPGPTILHERQAEGSNDYDYFLYGNDDTLIYDVIACFQNLETFTLFVKAQWEEIRPSATEALRQNLTRLKTLKIGGEIRRELLKALLSKPEQIESLSVINVIHTADQIAGPDGVLFLRPLRKKFTSLRRLHLSKLAELHENYEEMGMPWEFDTEQEQEVLEQWAGLLMHTCQTIEDLTLENCYHYDKGDLVELEVQDLISIAGHHLLPYTGDDGATTADDEVYGMRSSNNCRDILGPVLEEQPWPQLRHLKIKGIYNMKLPTLLAAGVKVEYQRGGFAPFWHEVTPLTMSPPADIMEIFRDQ